MPGKKLTKSPARNSRDLSPSSKDEEVLAAVPKRFPEQHYEIQHGVWVVAATNKTIGDICVMLGIHPGDEHEGRTGVVVDASDYNGYFNKGLWEKLQLWEDL